MLLNVFDLTVLSQVERVYAAVLGICVAVVVDAAACDYGDVGVIANVKIVEHGLFKAALTEQHRNVDCLVFRARLNVNVDAGNVSLPAD